MPQAITPQAVQQHATAQNRDEKPSNHTMDAPGMDAACADCSWRLQSTLGRLRRVFPLVSISAGGHGAAALPRDLAVRRHDRRRLWSRLSDCGLRSFAALAGDSRWIAGQGSGPIGMANALWHGRLPPIAGVTCLTNDVIWWVPFGIILWRAYQKTQADQHL
jgi:hypothetical protein